MATTPKHDHDRGNGTPPGRSSRVPAGRSTRLPGPRDREGWRALIGAYVDGELNRLADPTLVAAVEKAIGRSASLRAIVDEARVVGVVVRALPDVPAGEAARIRIQDRLIEAGVPVLGRASGLVHVPRRRRFAAPWQSGFAAAASVAIVLGLGVALNQMIVGPQAPVGHDLPLQPVDEDGQQMPPAELLQVMSLLRSDLEPAVLAAIDPAEITWLTDDNYVSLLESLDGLTDDHRFDVDLGPGAGPGPERPQ